MVAAIMVNRGVTSDEDARAYLAPSVEHLLDPFGMADMDRAAERIARAVRDKEPILVYGDYDVDGLSSTALMMQFLRYLGADPSVYVPNRATEGYSFTDGGVAHVKDTGATLVVSVDNGIASVAPVGLLQDAGVDVIITDHHLPPDELPAAFAVVNPRRKDCAYPFKGLAGVGVAFKVACAVAAKLSEGKRRSPEMMQFLGEAMAWVALGTVADMVPLSGENRILVARGLAAIPKCTSPGLSALCAVAGIPKENVEAEDVSWRLAPRLNAAGRLDRADLALEIVTETDEKRALTLAKQLDQLNTQRRSVDKQMLELVSDLLPRMPENDPIILHDDRFTAGLLGLVANRLVQRTGLPAVLISNRDGEMAKGSCRSILGFNAHDALAECDDVLAEHGGHAMAAGFTVRTENIDAFSERFLEVWRNQREKGFSVPPIDFDGELPLAALTHKLMDQFGRLGPFGQGNDRPVLGAMGVTVLESRRMGADGSHLTLQVGQGPTELRAVAFGRGDLVDELPRGAPTDLLFSPKLNRFRGRTTVELQLVDVRMAQRMDGSGHDALASDGAAPATPTSELGAEGSS
jgi:single-stranded-DNA-specific exonuclease